MFIGISILVIACLCQGSFGIGYKKYPPFSWAAFWGIYSICCIVVSGLAAFLLVPNFIHILGQVPWFGYICGALWALSAVCYSKGIIRVGLTMVSGISMGASTIVGTITPMLIDTKNESNKLTALMLVGMIITVVGIILFTMAGMKRDGLIKKDKLGYAMAIFSGFGTGAMNVGFSYSSNIEEMIGNDVSYLGISAVKWFPVLIGGLIVGILWGFAEVTIKKEWNTVVAKGAKKRIGLLFAISLVWYSALLLYGLANTMLIDSLGQMTWVIFNAISLMVSVFWGIVSAEWKGHKKTGLYLACGVLIVSLIIISLS